MYAFRKEITILEDCMVHSGLMRQTLKGPMYQNGITLLIPAMETGDGYINNDSLGSYRKKGKQFPNLKPRNQSYLKFFYSGHVSVEDGLRYFL